MVLDRDPRRVPERDDVVVDLTPSTTGTPPRPRQWVGPGRGTVPLPPLGDLDTSERTHRDGPVRGRSLGEK